MADTPQTVQAHYGSPDLGMRILAAIIAAGKDPDHMTPDDLAPLDQFHTGQRRATLRLARLAGIAATDQVLDVGAGIGGPARFLAHRFGCHVTGLDLTPEYCEVATMLTQRMGLAQRVSQRQGNALHLPFADETFDVVWSQNAAMNIAARDRLYAEMRRVLKLTGRLALQEVCAGAAGPPYYPAPWAREPSISFLLSPDMMREKLERAGLAVKAWEDTTQEALEQAVARAKSVAAPTLPPLGVHILIGSAFAAVTRNQLRSLEEGRIALINAVLERAPQ